MRKCLRCGAEMKENCDLRVQGAGYGVVLSTDESKLFGGRIGKPKVAFARSAGRYRCILRMWKSCAEGARRRKGETACANAGC